MSGVSMLASLCRWFESTAVGCPTRQSTFVTFHRCSDDTEWVRHTKAHAGPTMLFAQLSPAQLNGKPWDAEAIETLAVEWREVSDKSLLLLHHSSALLKATSRAVAGIRSFQRIPRRLLLFLSLLVPAAAAAHGGH